MKKDRMILRMIERDTEDRIVSILEQEIPASDHAVELFLRRAPFKETVAKAMLCKGKISIERKLA